MLTKLQQMVIGFLDALQAAQCCFLPDGALDDLLEPTQRGRRRLAGVDFQKPRMRAVGEALMALAPKPEGFSLRDLAKKTSDLLPKVSSTYTSRQAGYDLMKLRGKQIAYRVGKTRLYRLNSDGIRKITGLLTLREKVIKPVLSGVVKPRAGRPPKKIHPIDQHYANLQREMHQMFKTMGLAA